MEAALLLIILFPLSLFSSYEAKQVNSFSVDLIHWDSPLSPFYNPSLNQSELLRNAALRSISRIKTLFRYSTAYGNNAETVIIPNHGNYLMKMFIGTPPVESLVIADTGSDLIWVQCQPCDQCYPQKAPIFDPSKSQTYYDVSCHSASCSLLQIHACGPSSKCKYQVQYVDRSTTIGDFASDTIAFGPNSEIFSNTLFGCGHDNMGIFKATSTGLVGLGQGPLSFVSQIGVQIGHTFSYCLLPFLSTKSSSKITFGSDSTISGDGVVSIPLVFKAPNSYYYLTLLAISIGQDKVEPGNTTPGNIIVDSGSTLTFLESSLYNKVETAVIEAYGDDRQPIQNPPKPFKLCYAPGATTKDFPKITFYFAGSAKGLQLRTFNVVVRYNNLLCLMMVPTTGYSILGNLAQINFKVEYDLIERKVSFAPTNCRKE